MNYEEAVAYIEDIPRFTTKNSLDHTRECLKRLGDPQRKFRVIHVAGTNGKGSTCAFITSVLREAGYSCGLFTSPHLVEINERFQINEEVIDDDTFLRAFEKVKKLSDELVAEGSYHPTYFETLLLMGMVIFAEAGVDYVTLETGLGGIRGSGDRSWRTSGCNHCGGGSGSLCDHIHQPGSYAVSWEYGFRDRRREGRDHGAGCSGDLRWK